MAFPAGDRADGQDPGRCRTPGAAGDDPARYRQRPGRPPGAVEGGSLGFGAGLMAKILLVEDNEMNRDMLSRRLIRNGHEVSIAIDGQQGADMAMSQLPDLILMDMSLPVIDGWEATRRIKANEATRKIPVIALTAHAMAGDREKAMEVGCDDYDTKPVEISRLLGKIAALLAA